MRHKIALAAQIMLCVERGNSTIRTGDNARTWAQYTYREDDTAYLMMGSNSILIRLAYRGKAAMKVSTESIKAPLPDLDYLADPTKKLTRLPDGTWAAPEGVPGAKYNPTSSMDAATGLKNMKLLMRRPNHMRAIADAKDVDCAFFCGGKLYEVTPGKYVDWTLHGGSLDAKLIHQTSSTSRAIQALVPDAFVGFKLSGKAPAMHIDAPKHRMTIVHASVVRTGKQAEYRFESLTHEYIVRNISGSGFESLEEIEKKAKTEKENTMPEEQAPRKGTQPLDSRLANIPGLKTLTATKPTKPVKPASTPKPETPPATSAPKTEEIPAEKMLVPPQTSNGLQEGRDAVLALAAKKALETVRTGVGETDTPPAKTADMTAEDNTPPWTEGVQTGSDAGDQNPAHINQRETPIEQREKNQETEEIKEAETAETGEIVEEKNPEDIILEGIATLTQYGTDIRNTVKEMQKAFRALGKEIKAAKADQSNALKLKELQSENDTLKKRLSTIKAAIGAE